MSPGSKDAHIHALHDYFLMISPQITNLELRDFLQIANSRSATYILSTLDFPFSGSTKGRIYHQP